MEAILEPNPPKTDQDEPKRAIRSCKEPKNSLFKTLKKHLVFTRFWVQRPPKRASRSPRDSPETPKELQNHPKKISKIGPKN